MPPQKAFDLIFAEGLAEEMKQYGIRVCALCPGTTESEFHTVSGQEKFIAQSRDRRKSCAHGTESFGRRQELRHFPGSEIISAPIVSASSLAAWSPKSPPECSSPARNNGPSRPRPDHREWVLFQFILPAKATSTRGSLCLRLTHCENKDFQALRPGGPCEGELFDLSPGIDRCERAERLRRDEDRRASERRRFCCGGQPRAMKRHSRSCTGGTKRPCTALRCA